MLRPVVFGTLFAAVVHRGAAPTVSQLVCVRGGVPALRANPPVISPALCFGVDSDSDLDNLGAQLVKRVADIVAHGVHDRAAVSRCFAVTACILLGEVAVWRDRGPSKGLEATKEKVSLSGDPFGKRKDLVINVN